MTSATADSRQADAGTRGQCGRPPPLATPRNYDHDAKWPVVKERVTSRHRHRTFVTLWHPDSEESQFATLIATGDGPTRLPDSLRSSRDVGVFGRCVGGIRFSRRCSCTAVYACPIELPDSPNTQLGDRLDQRAPAEMFMNDRALSVRARVSVRHAGGR